MKNLNMTEEQAVRVFISDCETLINSWRGKGHGSINPLIANALLDFYDTLARIKERVNSSLELKKEKAEVTTPCETLPVSKFLTVKQFKEKHPWPSEGGLRNLIFYAETNGFNAVIRKAGRRVLISEEEFFKWLDSQKV